MLSELRAPRRQASDLDVPVFLLFSVQGSGAFCGVAQLLSAVVFDRRLQLWRRNDRWNGSMKASTPLGSSF